MAGRKDVPEVMDVSPLSAEMHEEALSGLSRLNRWSLAATPVKRAIADLARGRTGPTIDVLDIATGGGDIPLSLARWARQRGLGLRIRACDVSATAIAFASRQRDREGLDVDFFVADAKSFDAPDQFDVVICSLFLHHLEQSAAADLLSRMARAARRLVLVSDLRRNVPGLLLAYAATRTLTRSPVVHVDGPRSVRRAYTILEAHEIARQAQLYGADIRRCFPYRFLLTWERRDR